MFSFDHVKQAIYEQYALAHRTGDYSQLDPEQAQACVLDFYTTAPRSDQRQVLTAYLGRLSPGERLQVIYQLSGLVSPPLPTLPVSSSGSIQRARPVSLMSRVLNQTVVAVQAGQPGLAGLVEHLERLAGGSLQQILGRTDGLPGPPNKTILLGLAAAIGAHLLDLGQE